MTKLKEYLATVYKYHYLLFDLVGRDIKVKYRRSVLGILWSVLNPLLMMLVITAVFENVFRLSIPGIPFPVYYLTGSLVFNFVTEATSGAMVSVVGAAPLIKKVYIPKYIFPLQKCLFAFVNMFFSLAATLVMLLVLRVKITWLILLTPVPLFYAFVFCVGFGMLLTTFNVFFRDTNHLYSVWVTAWMYLTPIIYPMDILPDWMAAVVKCNPLYYFVEYVRKVMAYGTLPTLEDNLLCAAVSAGFLIVGAAVFRRKQDRFILFV